MNHGFDAYIVGGAIRDHLLGRPIHDIDVATSAHPADVMSLFKRTIPIGIEHGTVAVLSGGQAYEVTTYRAESGYDDFRHPNQVSFDVSLDQDLMRRDFTINAFAMDRSGQVIDLFGGKADIMQKKIRTVGLAEERISEDPLRIMRGIRFASELCFTLGQKEVTAFRAKSDLLKHISVERINQEMNRLLAGKGVHQAIRILENTGCVHALPLLENVDLKKLYDVDFSFLQTSEERWSAFLIAVGLHDVHVFARAWKWSRESEKKVYELTTLYNALKRNPWTAESVYFAGLSNAFAANRLLAAFGILTNELLMQYDQQVHLLWQASTIHTRSDIAATGHHFIQWSETKPGPWLAKVINTLEKEIVNGRVTNDLGEIEAWFRKWQISQKKQS
nr:CCA tRNA nucleotidyltransferase [Sporolactobacillus kofuensis]